MNKEHVDSVVKDLARFAQEQGGWVTEVRESKPHLKQVKLEITFKVESK